MKKLNQAETDALTEAVDFLKDILLQVGITELRISKQNKEIYYDTDEKGFDGKSVDRFHSILEDYIIRYSD